MTIGDRTIEVVSHAGQGPTIIFEASAGVGLTTWINFAQTLDPSIPWICYSRAGYRGSSSVPGERTPVVITRELHELLITEKLEPPYILVGHSYEGLCARVYSALYPSEISGLVLDDPSYESFHHDLKMMASSLFETLTAVPPMSIVRPHHAR